MTDAATSSPAAPPASASQQRYTAVAIALHWIIAFAIIGMIAVGWTMETLQHGDLEARALYQQVVQLHKSFGITILLLSVARVIWRLMNPPPPEVPMPGWQALAASAVHVLFYVLIIAMPLSGWIMASSSAAFETRYFGLVDIRLPILPTLPMESREGIENAAGSLHSAFAWVIVGLLVLHVAAALKHQLIDRDGLLARMAPGLFGRTAGPVDNGHGAIWAFGSAALIFAAVVGAGMLSAQPVGPAVAEEQQQPQSKAPTWVVDPAKSSLAFKFGYMGTAYEGKFPNGPRRSSSTPTPRRTSRPLWMVTCASPSPWERSPPASPTSTKTSCRATGSTFPTSLRRSSRSPAASTSCPPPATKPPAC